MQEFNQQELKNLFVPDPKSHKGQNGKVMVIGGSRLFHAAPLWSLKIASRIVDMVFFSSIEENNQVVQNLKEEFGNGIVVPRSKVADYINEADAVLIGPGLPRESGQEEGDEDTRKLTEDLLKKYPGKKWVIDGGSLQTIDPSTIPANSILTPHAKEFKTLFKVAPSERTVGEMAKKFSCVILLKGPIDIVSNGEKTISIRGGNAGMTKGGTGDVLAGLVTALDAKNEPLLAACSGSYINKKAGEKLAEKMGLYFNASDLADEIPQVMKKLL